MLPHIKHYSNNLQPSYNNNNMLFYNLPIKHYSNNLQTPRWSRLLLYVESRLPLYQHPHHTCIPSADDCHNSRIIIHSQCSSLNWRQMLLSISPQWNEILQNWSGNKTEWGPYLCSTVLEVSFPSTLRRTTAPLSRSVNTMAAPA